MQNQNELLSSVIEITRQRDKDSLEFSLVATLAELAPVNKVSFYRTLDLTGVQSLEEVVHLDTTKNEKGDLEFLWQTEAPIVKAEGELQKCWNNQSIIFLEDSEKSETTMLMPMLKGKVVIGMLSLSSGESLRDWQGMVEGLVKIYENYLYILSESEHDTLTGLLNRRSFDTRLNKLLELQKMRNEKDTGLNEKRQLDECATTWLVALDVDHFKKVNDDFGHMYGDEVLLLLAQLAQKSFRVSDLLFRFGGEEFVIILSSVNAEHAFSVLDRFREQVANYNFPQVGQVTISIGYASIGIGDYPPAVLDKADKALYHAKNTGRNQVCCYETLVKKGAIAAQSVIDDVELF